MSIWSLAFAKYAGERALKTFAQVMIAALTAAQLGILMGSWVDMLVVAGTAALVSLLTAVVAATPAVPTTEPAQAALTPEAEAAIAKLATPIVTDAAGNKLPA